MRLTSFHRLALRTPDEVSSRACAARWRAAGMPSSHILIEIAANGPGFAADETLATFGESLALPLCLEPRRRGIEAAPEPLARPRQ